MEAVLPETTNTNNLKFRLSELSWFTSSTILFLNPSNGKLLGHQFLGKHTLKFEEFLSFNREASLTNRNKQCVASLSAWLMFPTLLKLTAEVAAPPQVATDTRHTALEILFLQGRVVTANMQGFHRLLEAISHSLHISCIKLRS